MDRSERITVDPRQCGGKPCVRGMRVRVQDVLELLADGLNANEIIEQLPYLDLEDIEACKEYVARPLK